MSEAKKTIDSADRDNLAVSLYGTSIEDLESARILFNHGKYPNCIFFLQQCTEKLSKAIGIAIELIQPSELRTVNHSPHNIYKHANKDRIRELNENEEIFKKLIDDSEQIETYKSNLQKGVRHFQNINIKEFRYITIEELDELLEFIINPSADKSRKLSHVVEEIENNLKSLYDKIPVGEITLTQYLEKLIDEGKMMSFQKIAELEVLSITLNQTLLILSYILSPHQNSTRYPCEQCGSKPTEEYDSEHPLIKRFDSLDNLIMTSIKFFETIKNSITHSQQMANKIQEVASTTN
jgi:HEPN domain-containing protein